ncbi:MAG: hypothetical protein OEW75_07590 [Cyclobacteriaceae bacterium]|nr:hypothetical protein [Cyclobacteriaceae bacterium]
MKTLRTILTITMIAFGLNTFAQSYAFKVLANKGTNQVKTGETWAPLKTGSTLKSTDMIKVSANAYIGLMHAAGKTIEVRDAGTYKISELEAKVPKGSGVGGKYADYLASKMTAEGQKNRLSATGAVHRALTSASINVYLPQSVQIYGQTAIISWEPVEGDNVTYKVNLSNMFGDNLLSEETTNTYYELDLTDNKIENNDVILLAISTADDEDVKSEVIPIKKVKEDKKAQVKQGLNELMTDVNEKTALNKYILAGFYEDNNLLVDALTSYEEAIALAPEVEYYKEAKDDFLIRNGLKKSN